MAPIATVFAWEALDSRGNPTVACEVELEGGATGTAAVPSGASTGVHEARELRDGGERYGGLGVRRAVEHVNHTLGPAVLGADAADTDAVDALLLATDPTEDLREVGANAVLAVSLAALLAAADEAGQPLYRWVADDHGPLLPLPMVNIVSGGAHAGGAVDVQDVLAVPLGADRFSQALEWCWQVRRGTAAVLEAEGLPASLVADEGGLGPPLPSNRAALQAVTRGIEQAGLRPGADVGIAVDVAAGQLHRDGRYHLAVEGRALDAAALVDEVAEWCEDFPIVSVEDVCAEDDWDGWALATRRLGDRLQLVGDDLFATSTDRVERAVADGIANAVLVKPNQAGCVTRARDALAAARHAGYATIVSARSGDTEDAWLADLAVGWAAGQIKVGSVTRSERTAKWNRLLRIEAEHPEMPYAGTETEEMSP